MAATDVTRVIAEYLSENRGPSVDDPAGRLRVDYGVSGELQDGVLSVELRFRRGSAYCCYESGCHLSLQDGVRWDRLRACMRSCDISAPHRMTLVLRCVVEEGALFLDLAQPLPGDERRHALEPSGPLRYDETAVEGVAGL